jgi:hypothetical protein
MFKKIGLFCVAAILLNFLFTFPAYSQLESRNEIKIPAVTGYMLLKCDFHMHTVFSDGLVWPTIRPQEAWREGLDVIALSDHIEYLPYKDDIKITYQRPYEIALPVAEALKITLIRAAEITRSEPPGHLNAIFLNDINPLNTPEYRDALKAAFDQGAFIFWNHPGWKQPNNKSVWYDTQEEFLKKGWLHGIEVVNGNDYDPIAHQWCIDKNLTMMGNSDIHNPITMDYDVQNGKHRPMTLVLAEKKTLESIKSALFARRTVIYLENKLIGDAKYLRPIFDNSIQIKYPEIEIKGKNRNVIQIQNNSDLDYELVPTGQPEVIQVDKVVLYAGKTSLLHLRGVSETVSGEKNVKLAFTVQNLLIAPEKGLPVDIEIKINFLPTK